MDIPHHLRSRGVSGSRSGVSFVSPSDRWIGNISPSFCYPPPPPRYPFSPTAFYGRRGRAAIAGVVRRGITLIACAWGNDSVGWRVGFAAFSCVCGGLPLPPYRAGGAHLCAPYDTRSSPYQTSAGRGFALFGLANGGSPQGTATIYTCPAVCRSHVHVFSAGHEPWRRHSRRSSPDDAE